MQWKKKRHMRTEHESLRAESAQTDNVIQQQGGKSRTTVSVLYVHTEQENWETFNGLEPSCGSSEIA